LTLRHRSGSLVAVPALRADAIANVSDSASFQIQVNGNPRDVPCGTRVRELLELVGVGGRRVAVAVNRTVVPRSAYDTHPLAEGDRVEILEAVGGG
jgi:sulfur carrier protein